MPFFPIEKGCKEGVFLLKVYYYYSEDWFVCQVNNHIKWFISIIILINLLYVYFINMQGVI